MYRGDLNSCVLLLLERWAKRISVTWVYNENYNWVNSQEALKQELKEQILVQLSLHRLLRNICAEL